jgi:iron(III) transport system permease protein
MPVVSKAPSATAPASIPGWLKPLAIFTGFAFLLPLAYLLWATITLGSGFWGTLASSATLEPLARSLLLATATALLAAIVGSALALLVARTDLPGRRVLRVALALPLAVPSYVGATALLAAFGPGALVPTIPRLEGFSGALIVLSVLSYPYVYLPVLGRLATTAPLLEDAARQLGSTPIRVIYRVVLPQLRSAIGAGGLLVFLYVLSDFGAVSLLRYDTVTRAIFSARLFDRSTALTLGLVLGVLALLVVVAERALASRKTVATTGESRALRYELGRIKWPAVAGVAVVLGVALVAPVAVFLGWIGRGSATVGAGYGGLGDGLGFLVMPALNSTVISLITGALAVVVLLPLAYLAARRRTATTEGAGAIVTSVFALPGLVVALAVVFWAIQAPAPLAWLYQSFPLLVLGYLLHFGAQSLRSSQAAVAAVPPIYDDAARLLGADARRRFVAIELPLLTPGLMAGGGLVMLSTLKELPVTLLLAPIGFETLATQIWGAATDGFYAEVGVTSLVLIAVSTVLTWLFVVRPQVSGST